MMCKVIAICGIDGSGKTTQIELLEKYLKWRGFRVKRVWLRWVAFFSYPFLALCRILGYTKWRTVSRSNIRYAERRFYMSKVSVRLWPWLFTLDAFIYSIFKIKARIILGYTVPL
jgi:thymidylate kinase